MAEAKTGLELVKSQLISSAGSDGIPAVLAALSTGHMVGLAVVAAIFIGFALASSFLAPRRWPDFPGQNGLSVFLIVTVVLFAAMLTAVAVFGVEEPEKEKGKQKEHSAPSLQPPASAAGVILPTLSRS